MSDLPSPNADHPRHRDLVRIRTDLSPNNCDVQEKTGDGVVVGRCWFYAPDGVCPRHGDLSKFAVMGGG